MMYPDDWIIDSVRRGAKDIDNRARLFENYGNAEAFVAHVRNRLKEIESALKGIEQGDYE